MRVTVLFGSESNNAADLADRTAAALKKAHFDADAVDMASFGGSQWDDASVVLIITSTYGNGNPPSNAEALYAALMVRTEPLPRLRFAVCGLGDTTYDRFAQCGKDFDQKLGELGATQLVARQDCDVDYEEPWQAWLDAVLEKLATLPAESSVVPAAPPSAARVHPPGTRRNPLTAKVLGARSLCGAGSTKETIHVELELDPALAYEVGDSLGIFSENDPALVTEIIAKLGASKEAEITLRGAMHEGARGGGTMSIEDALTRHLDLQHVDVRLFDACKLPKSPDVHVIDLVLMRTATPALQTFVECLRPLAPRTYSIASSLRVHPRQAHLTVDVVRYEMRKRKRAGVASSMLADRCPPGRELLVYKDASPHFRLAADDAPIIMIGPGTGVAPFRAFLEERSARGAKGKNWLFFGARNACDSFYASDFEAFTNSGILTRIDRAFSRDQTDKIYVQHRLRENADEIRRWVADGATIYICGDAKKMAPDVQTALIEILGDVKTLEAEGRYKKDVY